MFTPLIENWVFTFALALVRVATFVALLPVLGRRHVPATVKIGLAFALAAMWFVRFGLTADRVTVPEMSWFAYALAVGREVFFGALLAFACGLYLVPLQIAGAYIAQEMGLTLATLTDPNTGANTSITSQLLESLGILLFFALDMHHVVFGALHASFLHLPLGTPGFADAAMLTPEAVAEAHQWGLLIAAPIGICLFATMIVLALVMRASPQFNLFSIGLALKVFVGLVTFVIFLPEMLRLVQQMFHRATGLVAWISST